jgi:hypothetical protein
MAKSSKQGQWAQLLECCRGPPDEHYKGWLEEKLALIAEVDIQVEKKASV